MAGDTMRRMLFRMSLVRVTLSLVTLAYLSFVEIHVFAIKRIAKRPTGEIKEKLLKYNIMPDVIPTIGYPQRVARVTWESAEADLGNFIPAQYTKTAPEVAWAAIKGQIYTLLMVDPDRDSLTEFEDHHYQYWLIGNIPGTNLTAGDPLTDYMAPIAPRPLAMHRFIFLVFKHPNKTKIHFDEPRLISNSDAFRAHFNTKKFMKKYNFKNAYAINFFHGEWPAWAPPEDESDIEVTELENYSRTTPPTEEGYTGTTFDYYENC